MIKGVNVTTYKTLMRGFWLLVILVYPTLSVMPVYFHLLDVVKLAISNIYIFTWCCFLNLKIFLLNLDLAFSILVWGGMVSMVHLYGHAFQYPIPPIQFQKQIKCKTLGGNWDMSIVITKKIQKLGSNRDTFILRSIKKF